MLIDMHTHVFPDEIASRALDSLKKGIFNEKGYMPDVYSDGTLMDLLRVMDESNVDISVVMPVVTKPSGSDSINLFASGIRSSRIISFGGVHPLQDNCEKTLYELAKQGFKGVKLHPEFQQCYIDSKESINLINKAEEYGLIVMVHAGQDIGLPPPVHCNPDRARNALNYVSGNNLILAHLGGWNKWEDVERYLVGQNVYFDTAFISSFIDKEQYKRIILSHGSDKIVFGSDMPWEKPSDTLKALNELNLSDTDMANIMYQTAFKLLKM